MAHRTDGLDWQRTNLMELVTGAENVYLVCVAVAGIAVQPGGRPGRLGGHVRRPGRAMQAARAAGDFAAYRRLRDMGCIR